MRNKEFVILFLAIGLFPVFLLFVALLSYMYEKYKKGLSWSELVTHDSLTAFKKELRKGLKEFGLLLSKPNDKLANPIWEGMIIWIAIWVLVFLILVSAAEYVEEIIRWVRK
jgi:hypothetical protein